VDVSAQVVHYGFGLVGLNFGQLDAASGAVLASIVNGTGDTWQQALKPL
jgi:hypothetical protein